MCDSTDLYKCMMPVEKLCTINSRTPYSCCSLDRKARYPERGEVP